MKHSEFTDKFHWLNGLDEYYKFIGKHEQWKELSSALNHNNYYKIRNIILEFFDNKYKHLDYQDRRNILNVLLKKNLKDIEITPQMVTNFINLYMKDDPFIGAICKFINYWAGDDDSEYAVMPDMNDFLSRGQVKSKLWLVTELATVVNGSLGNVLFYGGWYNFSAHFLFSQFEVNKIYSLDINKDVIDPSKRLYLNEVKQDRFLPKSVNVNKIIWDGKKTTVLANDSTQWQLCDNVDLVINTSCEHMDNAWFENLPEGTFVVLHQNDYFENPQHSNCCKDLEEVKQKYPMQNIFYEGELDTYLYNRFMLIGIK